MVDAGRCSTPVFEVQPLSASLRPGRVGSHCSTEVCSCEGRNLSVCAAAARAVMRVAANRQLIPGDLLQTNKQKFKVRQPQRAARSKRPNTPSDGSKNNTQACSYLDFNQFLSRRITRNICLRLRIKQIQILTCREQDIW